MLPSRKPSTVTKRALGLVVRVAVVAALVGAVWWFASSAWDVADELRANVLTYRYRAPEPADEVLAVTAETITLARSPRTQLDGMLAIETPGGRGLLGEVRAVDADAVVRGFNLVAGEVDVGDAAVLGPQVRPGDPFSALGIPFDEVAVEGPLGTYPAWFVEGERATWVIYVHGWGSADRAGVNNLLPLLVEIGYPVLAISYRDDPTAPPADDEVFRWGLNEWEDVDAAARWARQQGADNLVLYAHDQGAALTSMFLLESPLRTRTVAVIYDSPVLAVDDVADAYTEFNELPRYFASPGKALATFRFHMPWSRLDQLGRADEWETPMLLIHGTADQQVPVETSVRFAEARPDLVTFERFEGVGHLLAWNADRTRYELAVRRLFTQVEQQLAER